MSRLALYVAGLGLVSLALVLAAIHLWTGWRRAGGTPPQTPPDAEPLNAFVIQTRINERREQLRQLTERAREIGL